MWQQDKQEECKNEYKYNLDKERGWRVKNRKRSCLGALQETVETEKKEESGEEYKKGSERRI
jgi:hypothetical protein